MLKIKLDLTSEHAKVGEIKAKVKESVYKHLLEEGLKLELDEVSPPIIAISKDRRVINMARNDQTLSELEKGHHFVALQRETYGGQDINDLIPVELVIM